MTVATIACRKPNEKASKEVMLPDSDMRVKNKTATTLRTEQV